MEELTQYAEESTSFSSLQWGDRALEPDFEINSGNAIVVNLFLVVGTSVGISRGLYGQHYLAISLGQPKYFCSSLYVLCLVSGHYLKTSQQLV